MTAQNIVQYWRFSERTTNLDYIFFSWGFMLFCDEFSLSLCSKFDGIIKWQIVSNGGIWSNGRQELYEVYAAVLLLEKYGKTVSDKDIKLPKELDTDEARKYFAKAMEKQYLEAVDGGKYRWIGTDNKGKTAELAYFLGRVYNYANTETGNDGENFPEESLNELFGAKRLYSSLTQVYNAQKPQRWRSQIDEMFDWFL